MKKTMFAFSLLFILFSVFASGSFANTPFQLLDNRIITQIYVNHQGPFFVMVDTGATNILSNEVATKLNLVQTDQFPIFGGGENMVMASHCKVKTLSIDSQVLENTQVICMNLKDLQQAIGFPQLDGLIGYEVFSRYLTQINFDKMEISLSNFYQGTNIPTQEPSQVIPLRFQGTTPVIDAVLDGIAGSFWLDTGDRFSATLSSPFAKVNSLNKKYHFSSPMMTGYGIGGPLSTTVAFAGLLQHVDSEVNFINPLIRSPAMNSKALNDPNMAGTIGMGVLRQFNIFIDYSRRQMTLTKNSVFKQDQSFDRSGFWLSQSTDGFIVTDVLQDGPAWNAGIRPNQFVLAVNNTATSQIKLLNLREKLKDPQNTQVTLLVRDTTGTRSITIYLKDLIQPAP